MRGLGGFPSDFPFIDAIEELHFGDEAGELTEPPEPRSFQTPFQQSCAGAFKFARGPVLSVVPG